MMERRSERLPLIENVGGGPSTKQNGTIGVRKTDPG